MRAADDFRRHILHKQEREKQATGRWNRMKNRGKELGGVRTREMVDEQARKDQLSPGSKQSALMECIRPSTTTPTRVKTMGWC